VVNGPGAVMVHLDGEGPSVVLTAKFVADTWVPGRVAPPQRRQEAEVGRRPTILSRARPPQSDHGH
jgi:hypothetical protein